MKRLILTLAGIAAISACSDTDSHRAPEDDNLTRPLEVARADTSSQVAPVERQVTKPDEAAKVTTPKPKRQPKKAPAPRRAKAPAPAVGEDTTTSQGYVAAPRDTAAAPAVDSSSTPSTDTLSPTGSTDTLTRAASDTAVVAPEEIASARTDTAGTRTDTVRTNPSDTASAPPADTSSRTRADTTPARNSAPVDSTPSVAPVKAVRTLPVGTEIHAALDDSINSRTDTVGRVVTAVVMEPVTASDGSTLIQAGAPVRFTVTRLRAARSKSAQGRLALQVDGIGVGGELHKVSANVKPVPHELRGRGVGTSEAAKVGVGAAGGAVLGRVIGGNTKGAVIGGVVGAAGGAVVASQTATRDVVVKAKTPVVLTLTEPLVAQ
jgi:hypothetical protein